MIVFCSVLLFADLSCKLELQYDCHFYYCVLWFILYCLSSLLSSVGIFCSVFCAMTTAATEFPFGIDKVSAVCTFLNEFPLFT